MRVCPQAETWPTQPYLGIRHTSRPQARAATRPPRSLEWFLVSCVRQCRPFDWSLKTLITMLTIHGHCKYDTVCLPAAENYSTHQELFELFIPKARAGTTVMSDSRRQQCGYSLGLVTLHRHHRGYEIKRDIREKKTTVQTESCKLENLSL